MAEAQQANNKSNQGYGKKILVVDDEENMRHMLNLLLTQEGYKVDTAADGKEALGKISNSKKTGEYSAILCDIRMPTLDGMQFLEFAVEKSISIPIIMMSAYGTMDVAVNASSPSPARTLVIGWAHAQRRC